MVVNRNYTNYEDNQCQFCRVQQITLTVTAVLPAVTEYGEAQPVLPIIAIQENWVVLMIIIPSFACCDSHADSWVIEVKLQGDTSQL